MSIKKEETILMNEIVDKSSQAILLAMLALTTPHSDNEVLKNFVLWSLVIRDPVSKKIRVRHKVHSNWNPEDVHSMEILARGFLINIISKLGLPRVQEILTNLKLGSVDDTQDHIN